MCCSDTLSRTQAFEGPRRFREDREIVEDDERSGRPQTSHTAENLEKFSAVVRKNRFQTAMRGKKKKIILVSHHPYSPDLAIFLSSSVSPGTFKSYFVYC
ncbi:hypothetical protein TNCV_4767661 [Trichonephila clavipes]|nr:hypothetical protein TNCV_4767661 [Trichonephila clavipes]